METYTLRRTKSQRQQEEETPKKQHQESGYVVGAYVRVSTLHEDQLTSLKNQQEILPNKADYLPRELRKDGYVSDVIFYTDAGITGTRATLRPKFQEMIEDAKAGKIDIISCKNISRFSRNLADAVNYIRELTEASVAVFFREEGLYNMGSNFGLMFSMLSSIAEQESINISSHIMDTFHRYMAEGVKVNASAPFGYDCISRPDLPQKRILVPNADAKVVRQIFDWYLEGYTTPQIEKKLLSEFCIRKRSTTISAILHNPVYFGLLVQRKSYTQGVRGKRLNADVGIPSPYRHEGIVSEAEFNRVQEILYERAHVPETRSGAVPLTGLMTCGRCGCTFVRHNDRGMVAWSCSSYQKHIQCKGRSVKTIHDETIKRLFTTAVVLLRADAKRYGERHYSKETLASIADIVGDAENIRQDVREVIIGNERTEHIVQFMFRCRVCVEIETISTDLHYRKEPTIRLWEIV